MIIYTQIKYSKFVNRSQHSKQKGKQLRKG